MNKKLIALAVAAAMAPMAANAEVEVYATGMEEVQRLVDLAGIFHKEKAGSMGIGVDPVGAIDIPAGAQPATVVTRDARGHGIETERAEGVLNGFALRVENPRLEGHVNAGFH